MSIFLEICKEKDFELGIGLLLLQKKKKKPFVKKYEFYQTLQNIKESTNLSNDSFSLKN